MLRVLLRHSGCRCNRAYVTMATSSTMTSQSMTSHLVAVCQMRSTEDKIRNLDVCRRLIERASEKGAKMVFLPESAEYLGRNGRETLSLVEPHNGPTLTKFRELARNNGVWLCLGIHRQADDQDDKYYNSQVVLDSEGQVQGCYDKVHLFGVDLGEVKLQESDYTAAGRQLQLPVSTPVGQVGLTICYDLRFPEVSQWLTERGAEIITYPSAFTVPTGHAHWHALLRARAIETQCYVVAAAQIGEHNDKRTSYGHALIADPWGRIVAECTEEEDVQLAEINLTELRAIRDRMPIAQHRRHDLYQITTTVPSPSNDLCHRTTNVPSAPSSERSSYQFGHVTIDSDCVFYTSCCSYAFVNIKPVIPGHSLISPIEPVERFVDLSAQQTADLFATVQKVARVLQRVHQTDSVTIAVQDGPNAGQTVKHVHVHVLPRKPGDFKQNDDIYEKLEDHDSDLGAAETKPLLRTQAEMAEEAAMMRRQFSAL